APGDRIVVKRGVYREIVVVDRTVDIVGDGAAGAVVLEARDDSVVQFKTAGGRLENVAVRQRGGGEGCGVLVEAGYVELERCDITSTTASCIVVRDASVTITECSLHDSAWNGIFISDGG